MEYRPDLESVLVHGISPRPLLFCILLLPMEEMKSSPRGKTPPAKAGGVITRNTYPPKYAVLTCSLAATS